MPPACRRPHDANAFGIQLPLVRVGAHQPHRAGGVLQHDRMPVAGGAEPVFQDKPCDPRFIQEPRIVVAFVRGQGAIAAPRADYDGRTGRLGRVGPIRRERGYIFVRRAKRSRRPIRPERERISRLRLSRGETSEECGHKDFGVHWGGRISAPPWIASEITAFSKTGCARRSVPCARKARQHGTNGTMISGGCKSMIYS